MIKVLLDNDVDGFHGLLAGAVESTGWSEFQLVEFITLNDAGLDRSAGDREIWRQCQSQRLLLLTANRNRDVVDSLEQTINEENSPDCLPVITISDQQRLHNATYRKACVESLLTIVLDLSNQLGTGRLYIP